MIWDEKLFYFSKIAGIEKYMLNENNITGQKLYNILINLLNDEELDYALLRNKYKNLNRKYVQKFLEENV